MWHSLLTWLTYQIFYKNRVATWAGCCRELDLGPVLLVFFGMPPALYTQFKLLPKCQSIMYIARVGSHTIFLGVFHDSTSLSQSSSVVDFTGEVLVTWCSGKGSKYSSFNRCRCWQIAIFIISIQPFFVVGSSMLMSNFVYLDGKTYL